MKFEDGTLAFTTDLEWADYFILGKLQRPDSRTSATRRAHSHQNEYRSAFRRRMRSVRCQPMKGVKSPARQ